jgi:hypothetical protein
MSATGDKMIDKMNADREEEARAELCCNDKSPFPLDKSDVLYCELPKGHDSFHKNGVARWGRRDRKA